MIRKNTAAERLTRLSACAAAIALLTGGVASAQSTPASQSFTDGVRLQPLYMMDEAASTPVMQNEMRQRGLGGSWLEKNDIKFTGYVEVGWDYNFDRPDTGSNGPGRLFDDTSDDPKLNQLSLQLKREALVSRDRFDTGFDVQMIFGQDARYTQANGTNFYGSHYAQERNFQFFNFQSGAVSPVIDEASYFPGQEYPGNQLDILQANVSFNLPVGNGLLLKIGKFVAPWGIEQIDPTKNWNYSHSYIFSVSTPRTLTGITADYHFDDQWSAMGGIVLGWNQSLEDNNDCITLLGQGRYKYSDDWNFVMTTTLGPEQEDSSDVRFLLDFTAEWKAADDTNVGFEMVTGYEPDCGISRSKEFTNNRQLTVTNSDATWFGAAGYVEYSWDREGMITTALRGEFFQDADGDFLISTEVWAITGTLIYRPFPTHEVGRNLMIRPEVRYDYANDEIFDANTSKGQITFGADLVFSF